MRVSSNLRRFRWAVFTVWLLLLVPSVYLAMNQAGNLTGGGFEVAGSQSLYVQRQLEAQFPDQGASPLALVAAPRADAIRTRPCARAGRPSAPANQRPVSSTQTIRRPSTDWRP
mgnify:CR=1 FL=1